MRNQSLLLKFALVFLIFTAVTLLISGIATYANQTGIYQAQQERKLQDIAEYLTAVITADGNDFPMYQEYFLAHYEEMNVPLDFTDTAMSRKVYKKMFAEQYPGKIPGMDAELSELSPEARNAYAVYNHEYYLNLFEADVGGMEHRYVSLRL